MIATPNSGSDPELPKNSVPDPELRNVDPAEIEKFSELAHRWWDPHGEFKPLHDINPLRLDWIDARAGLAGKKVLDVGCGGGILAESMARRGAEVTGIDLAGKALRVAELHLHESNLQISYQKVSAEDFAAQNPAAFDVVTCMELLEHVPDPGSMVDACARLVRPGGQVFFSTINRNPKAYLFAVIGAEYVLGLLPKGTHDYMRFIKPSELARWGRAAGLHVAEMTGMTYNPLSKHYRLERGSDVNYILHCVRDR
jgi:2-polyprenyl-6-hydroxyphenyl methylase/3-demethylubiquinone-9 3-methyltransferase